MLIKQTVRKAVLVTLASFYYVVNNKQDILMLILNIFLVVRLSISPGQ